MFGNSQASTKWRLFSTQPVEANIGPTSAKLGLPSAGIGLVATRTWTKAESFQPMVVPASTTKCVKRCLRTCLRRSGL